MNFIEHLDKLIKDSGEESLFTGVVDDSTIKKFEAILGVPFPKSYKEFIKEYGTLSFCGDTYYGITGKGKDEKRIPCVLFVTQKARGQGRKFVDPAQQQEGTSKYQFVDLSASAGIDKNDMGKFLKGKGILEGKEQTYLDAAKKYNINEAYLAAHSSLETANGTSELASGININGKKVYNMYGIGAVDGDAINSGAKYAYKMGWDTPEKAIDGGAKWMSEKFINNGSYGQNTLYKMRWNPASPGVHQYATDINWAVAQTKNIKIFLIHSQIPSYHMIYLNINNFKRQEDGKKNTCFFINYFSYIVNSYWLFFCWKQSCRES
ncbi:glucosaminidase domain-containing protein [Pantoea sp. FN0307]|uniref:glucosaminidase domain-containing protein n=1 Tax=Pantoea sp. FN0307 TaxID=3418560 RepID=UPI003CF2F5E7